MNHSTPGLVSSERILPQPCSSDGTEERIWLLRRLRIRGPQVTTMSYARSFIFPDLLMVHWANANDVALDFYSLTLGMKAIPFVRFTLKEERRFDYLNDWYEKRRQHS